MPCILWDFMRRISNYWKSGSSFYKCKPLTAILGCLKSRHLLFHVTSRPTWLKHRPFSDSVSSIFLKSFLRTSSRTSFRLFCMPLGGFWRCSGHWRKGWEFLESASSTRLPGRRMTSSCGSNTHFPGRSWRPTPNWLRSTSPSFRYLKIARREKKWGRGNDQEERERKWGRGIKEELQNGNEGAKEREENGNRLELERRKPSWTERRDWRERSWGRRRYKERGKGVEDQKQYRCNRDMELFQSPNRSPYLILVGRGPSLRNELWCQY